MRTLIDPFELTSTMPLPPPRAPMMTISVDVEFEAEEERTPSSDFAPIPDSWSRVRCWCSED